MTALRLNLKRGWIKNAKYPKQFLFLATSSSKSRMFRWGDRNRLEPGFQWLGVGLQMYVDLNLPEIRRDSNPRSYF